MKAGDVAEFFLSDGGQPAADPAGRLAEFVSSARRSLDIAIYDFETDGAAGGIVAAAIRGAVSRGVGVRIAHNADGGDGPDAPRPPRGSAESVAALGVPMRPVSEDGALMHHKYIVRDGADVLTGSTNWSDDAFSREENVIVTVRGSAGLASAFTRNFEHLFTYGHVHGSGGKGPELVLGHGVRLRPYFSPHPLGAVETACMARADRRLRVVSPVVTSGAVLGVLAEMAGHQHFDLDGAYDATQMEEVMDEWRAVPHNGWKIGAWEAIAPRLSGKVSTPWSPTSVHDFMHAKFVVADDEVIVGSYNLSRHGETNAENVLHIVSEYHADAFAAFADLVAGRYRRS